MCADERKKDEESCIATNCKSQEVSPTSLHIPTKAEIHPKNPKGGTPTGSRVKHGACPYAVDHMDIRGGVTLCAIRAVVYGGPDAHLFGRKIKSRFRPSRKIER
jgi:hypothetical protein